MFHILRGGCAARHPSPFHLSREQGMPNYVLLLLRTAGEFWIDGIEMTARPGHAVLISPGTPYRYRSLNSEYMDDWLHFEYFPESAGGDAANSITANPSSAGGITFPADTAPEQFPFLPTNRFFPIHDTGAYSALLRQLLWEKSYSPPSLSAKNTDALFYILFNHLSFDYSHPEASFLVVPFQEQLRMVRLNLQNSPEHAHSIARYAAELGISESYFQHLYHKLFGISFQKDCIKLRVEHAMELLDGTDLTVEQLCTMCGYHNEVHFYRQFKAVAGCTPAQYRRRFVSKQSSINKTGTV